MDAKTYTTNNILMPHRPSRGAISRVALFAAYSRADCLSECLEVLSNKSWLYGSEALVLSTDVMLSLMMMMMLWIPLTQRNQSKPNSDESRR
ncbi:hypothetical protein T265_05356 [Opisthorchis viverrini]|uniref:Uncharacterized protein n=1 Tax=Opisthorchis viverrini TaxID=6198 RepID=A0A074ZKS6_OPIVI|nr:hypothetical protein T265_05356 [Opisthorchis viverrini]KER27636.1 hypothetical protein T265_05356 [Opisthorchis viverrini]